jgi:hypothetical protein
MTVLFIRIRAVYETLWIKVVEPGRSQMAIWRMRIASYILKATNTLSEYVIRIILPLQQWLHEWASMLRFSTLPAFLKALFE